MVLGSGELASMFMVGDSVRRKGGTCHVKRGLHAKLRGILHTGVVYIVCGGIGGQRCTRDARGYNQLVLIDVGWQQRGKERRA